jgi:hypothetical protein
VARVVVVARAVTRAVATTVTVAVVLMVVWAVARTGVRAEGEPRAAMESGRWSSARRKRKLGLAAAGRRESARVAQRVRRRIMRLSMGVCVGAGGDVFA